MLNAKSIGYESYWADVCLHEYVYNNITRWHNIGLVYSSVPSIISARCQESFLMPPTHSTKYFYTYKESTYDYGRYANQININ